MIKSLFSKTFLKFLIVGCVNTLVGATIMFVAYNVLHWTYWFSSACNYVLASILSYFLNRHFTFENKDNSIGSVIRFAINIIVCYLIAYGIAKPLVRQILNGYSLSVQDNLAMVVGMGLFMFCNFFGQKFYVFKQSKTEN